MDKKYQEVTDLLSECEELFEKEPINAIKKMIDLYAKANEVFNHEVADAINLWISDNMNDEVVKYLQSKITVNNNLNRIYTIWILGNASD